jgi:hypothetical protein
MDKKMEVFTGLVPNEYVGYHPLEHYSQADARERSVPHPNLNKRVPTKSPKMYARHSTEPTMRGSTPKRSTYRHPGLQGNIIRAPLPNSILLAAHDADLRTRTPPPGRRI